LNQSPSSKMLEGIKGWGILNLISYASANHTASINKLAAYREREERNKKERSAAHAAIAPIAATCEKRNSLSALCAKHKLLLLWGAAARCISFSLRCAFRPARRLCLICMQPLFRCRESERVSHVLCCVQAMYSRLCKCAPRLIFDTVNRNGRKLRRESAFPLVTFCVCMCFQKTLIQVATVSQVISIITLLMLNSAVFSQSNEKLIHYASY
jgi:hypothetical protein